MTDAPRHAPRRFSDVEEVYDALRAAGHRLSAPARLVVDALFAADGPVSAEHIAEGGGDPARRLELTSVYRNLERLQELGVVSHVHLGHGAGRYALAREGPREYLVCEGCGRVTDVDAARLDGVRELLRESFGYHARFSHFPIHGYCPECEAAQAR